MTGDIKARTKLNPPLLAEDRIQQGRPSNHFCRYLALSFFFIDSLGLEFKLG